MTEICEITCAEVTPLKDEALFGRWLERMPESRKRKVTGLRHAESQRLSLGVGILLFQALESRGVDGRTVRIAEGEYGQPYLPEHPEIRFSLSHAGDWALCAVSCGPVGCDAERIARADERIARRCFLPDEIAALDAAADPAARKRVFTEIWTRKESRAKADGRGLGMLMRSFSVIHPEPGVWYDEGDAPEGYVFTCCAFGKTPPEFRWKKLDIT